MIPSPYTDTWLAEELAARLRSEIAWDAEREVWMVWRAPIWVEDRERSRIPRALAVVYDLRDTMLPALHPDAQRPLHRAIERWQRAYGIERVLEHARHLLIAPQPASVHVLAARNGALILHPDGSHTFRLAVPEDGLRTTLGCRYDLHARAPRWLRWLEIVSAGDAAWVDALQRWLGYCLSPETGEQKFAFHLGSGSNGKSVTFSALQRVFGGYARDTPFRTFVAARQGSIATHDDALMALEGAHLVVAQEGAVRIALDDATIKRVTGERTISGSRKFERTRTFEVRFKLNLCANDLPRVADVSPAFWRRVLAWPWRAHLGNAPLPIIAELLSDETELPGILNWLLAGYAAWRQRGLRDLPDCMVALAERWRGRSNPLAEWLTDRVFIRPGASEAVSDLYADYQRWCAGAQVLPAHADPTRLWQALERMGYEIYRRGPVRRVRGVMLRPLATDLSTHEQE